MSNSNFPNGFAHNVSIRGVPLTSNHAGQVFHVNNSSVLSPGSRPAPGSDSNAGTQNSPLSTIAAAVAKCVANRGDVILVAPGHAETVASAAAIALSVAGISLVGLGKGDKRPVLTFATATTATVTVTGANVSIKNIKCVGNIASLAIMIKVSGKNVSIEQSSFIEGSAVCLNNITLGVADNDADRAVISNCEFYHPTTGPASAVSFAKDHIGVRIVDCRVHGDYSNACIDIPSAGNAQVDLLVDNCNLVNLKASASAFKANGTGNSGLIKNTTVRCDVQSTAVDAGGLLTDRVFWGNLSTDNAIAIPVATSGTALAASKSLADAIGSDGTTLSYGSGSAIAGVGSSYIFKKTLTSSAITQAGVLAVTASAALAVEQIIVQSDATGLAAGTNFTLTHDNAKGVLVFAGAAVSGLDANKTVALTAGAQPNMVPYTFLESGATVTAKCTGADCTGSGTIDVYFVCKRLTAGAALS